MKQHLLFVCTSNVSRSPAAVRLFTNSLRYEARSAGIRPLAGRPTHAVTQDLIDWADVIFVMSEREDKHLTFLQQHFNLLNKKIYDLDIADIYAETRLGELESILRQKLAYYIT